MAEERQDTSPLDSTANAAMQTAKTAKQAKQIADGVKSAKNAAKGTPESAVPLPLTASARHFRYVGSDILLRSLSDSV